MRVHKAITICEYSCLSVFNINFEESTYNCQVWRETKVKENLCSLKKLCLDDIRYRRNKFEFVCIFKSTIKVSVWCKEQVLCNFWNKRSVSNIIWGLYYHLGSLFWLMLQVRFCGHTRCAKNEFGSCDCCSNIVVRRRSGFFGFH